MLKLNLLEKQQSSKSHCGNDVCVFYLFKLDIMYWWDSIVLILAFLGMEFMAWATHKYVMHGLMWHFHSDHHVEEPGFFERNDVFFLIYAIPSWLCIMLGMMYDNYFPVWIGYGIATYGFAYFMFHDVYIHRRFKWLRDIDHPYFMAIRKAHTGAPTSILEKKRGNVSEC